MYLIKNVVSTIYRIRNHPSLLVWTGGNEGHARKELYDAMRNNVIDLDGTRPFIPCSSGFAKLPAGWKGSYPDDLSSGVYSGGPYQWEDPKVYFKKVDNGGDWVFKDETGIPSQPPYNTLVKTIPDLVWDTKLPFPLNNSWAYHDACTGAARYDLYIKEMVKRYGQPTTMQEYSEKMQLMNWVGYQGIFEAAGHKLNETGGVMLWKLNSALPSVVWQIYDWYLEPNAGYYALQNAVEPLHIQFNPADSTVAIVNRRHHATGLLTVKADIYDADSKLLRSFKVTNLDLAESGNLEAIKLKEYLATLKSISFVVLNLMDAADKAVSHNVYWVSPGNDLTGINNMKPTQVQVKVLKAEKGTTEDKWTLQVWNPTDKLAFFIRPQLMIGNEEVMPSYWSASYFTLAPGESTTVSVSAPTAKLGTQKPYVEVSGWNAAEQTVSLSIK